MEIIIEIDVKEATKGVLSPINGTVHDIVKQDLDRGAEENVISATLDRLTKS